MTEDKNRKAPEEARASGGEMSESEIDKSLMESFPASDPPSWTLGTDHQTEAPDPPAEQTDEQK
jgi:hypothetical protein